MVNEVGPPELGRLAQPQCQPCLTELPVELLFHITRHLVGMGRECDVSSLARTNKRMYFVVHAELYRLVIKYRTFYIVHWATRENRMATLRTALAQGADPNQSFTLGYNERYTDIISPRSYRPIGWGLNIPRKLDWAVRAQIALLLRPKRTTPLHLAALAPHDNPEVTEALLANGADIDITGNGVCRCDSARLPSYRPNSQSGRIVAYTPLHVAICSRNYSTARVLVAHGAQRMAKLFSGNNERSWLPENALHTALSKPPVHQVFDYDFIEFLLRNGYAARIEERNHEGLTPLLLASTAFEDMARDKVVKLLLRYGAEIDNQGPPPPKSNNISGPLFTNQRATPALWAARTGQFRLCRLLLEHGADINARSSVSLVTILHAVCSRAFVATHFSITKDRTDLFDYVLANVSDECLNAFDVNGRTPLSMIGQWILFVMPLSDTESKMLGMGSRLFGKGADILAGIKEGRKTPFEDMIESAFNIYDYGFSKSWKPSQFCDKVLAIIQASRIDQHPDIPKPFLHRLWDIWGRAMGGHLGSSWRLRLQMASSLVDTFIKVGISPAEVDSRGNNALASFLKFLIDHPHLVVYRSPYGNGSVFLYWERYHGISFALSTIAVLQDNGAAPHVKNEEGHTAFDYLNEITEYDGQDQERVALARVMKGLVQCGKDKFGHLYLEITPPHRRFGSFDEVYW